MVIQIIYYINKNYYYYFFIVSLGYLCSQTYNISGKISDFQEKVPLSDVNIYIENTDFGTATDLDGNFVLELNQFNLDSLKLKIKMIGYKELIIPLDKSKSQFCSGCTSNIIQLGEIFLINQHIELESIHIHAFDNISSQISQITINGQELNNSISGNIAKTLENYPNFGFHRLELLLQNQF